MEDIQFSAATPEKSMVSVNTMQQTNPPLNHSRKILFKVSRYYEELSSTPSSPSATTPTTRVLTKTRLERYNRYLDTKRERQRTQKYLDKFTDPTERRKKLLNMVHSMYPSNEAFHTARHPFYDPDEHGYYDDFLMGRMYEGKRGGGDDDHLHEDDPRMHGHEVWEPKIGDDGIDTQEDLDMVLAVQSQYDMFFDNIYTTKTAQREAARLAREREPGGYQRQESENGAVEGKTESLIFGEANKPGKQVARALMLVRSERNAHHIVPGTVPRLSAQDTAHLERLEAKGEPSLMTIIRQEEALWYERKWRQGIVIPRDSSGNIELGSLSRELGKHIDQARRYWYRELRQPRDGGEKKSATVTIRVRPRVVSNQVSSPVSISSESPGSSSSPATSPTPTTHRRQTQNADRQASNTTTTTAAVTPSPARRGRPPKIGSSSPGTRGRGRGRPRRRPGRGLAKFYAPDAAYDPTKDGDKSSDDGSYKPRSRSTRSRGLAGTGGAWVVDEDVGMTGRSSGA